MREQSREGTERMEGGNASRELTARGCSPQEAAFRTGIQGTLRFRGSRELRVRAHWAHSADCSRPALPHGTFYEGGHVPHLCRLVRQPLVTCGY